MEPLTTELQRMLSFLEQYCAEHGYAPTVLELRESLDIPSPYRACKMLRDLGKLGHIAVTDNTARGIRLRQVSYGLSDRVKELIGIARCGSDRSDEAVLIEALEKLVASRQQDALLYTGNYLGWIDEVDELIEVK